ncbi:MAG TPA: DUF805 domain-containing protein [Pseudomonas sp.]|uniref:DUF805 domain-containing protein n=1 Tax=Pseudomonas sp. TaxID=306 RepID=UPI002EDA63D5
MAEHFSIVFEGQRRNGVELETAKLNLAQLFKSDVSAIERLFSGKPITVKRGLTHDDAQRYLKALNDAGVEARIERETPIALTLEEIEEPSVQRPAYESVATSPYAPPRAAVTYDRAEIGELKVFTVQGRIGRLRYLAWSMVLMFVALIMFALCMSIMSMSLIAGGLFGAVIFVVFLVVSIQIGAQRLHDAGWSAWLLLLNLVPFVGSFFPFLMIAVPGNTGPNQYGAPQPPNTKAVKILAALWLPAMVIIFVSVQMGGLQTFKDEVEITTSEYEQTLPYDDDSDSDTVQPANPSDPADSADDEDQ